MGIQAKLHVNLRLLSNLFWTKCNVCSLIVQRTFVNILTWGNRSSFPTPQSSPPLWIPERVYWWTSLYTDPCIPQQTKNYVICHQLVSRDLKDVWCTVLSGWTGLSAFQTSFRQIKRTDYSKDPGHKTAGGGFGPVRYKHTLIEFSFILAVDMNFSLFVLTSCLQFTPLCLGWDIF